MIRIAIVGSTGSGKSAVAEVIQAALAELGARVELDDQPDGPSGRTIEQSREIIRNVRPITMIETIQTNRATLVTQGFPSIREQLTTRRSII